MEIPVYSSNSDKSKIKAAEEETRSPKAPVVSGTPRLKKKTKFAQTFISNEAKNVKPHILNEVVIPKLKEMIFYSIVDALQMTLGVNLRGFVGGKTSGPSKTTSSYTQCYTNSDTVTARVKYAESQSGFDYNNVSFETRSDAETVLDAMWELINSQYKMASVLDLYEFSNVPTDGNYNLANYGWKDLRGTRIERRLDGEYVIVFPRCVPLK